jgi:paraquat-inducible protein B
MSQKPNTFRIGLFVLGGVALVVVALFAFGIRNAFEKKHALVTYVPGDVDGLAVGSAVRLKGVNVGQVTNVDFSWNRYPGSKTQCVIVEFEVKDSLSPVPKGKDFAQTIKDTVAIGLRAIVKTQIISGISTLELEVYDPARSPLFPYDWPAPREPYVPAAPSEFGRIVGTTYRVLAKLDRLDLEKVGTRLESTLAAAETAMKQISQLDAGGISSGANRTLTNANAAVLEVQELAREARAKVQGLPTEEIGQDLRRVIAGLEATNVKIQVAVDRLSGVDVRELNDTLADLRLAARGLADAIATIRKQPSQLLLGGSPPPASAVGKEERK